MPAGALSPATLLGDRQDSLAAWCTLYVELEAGANAENTLQGQDRRLAGVPDLLRHGDRRPTIPTSGPARSPPASSATWSGRRSAAHHLNRMLATLAARGPLDSRPPALLAGEPTERLPTSPRMSPSGRGSPPWR